MSLLEAQSNITRNMLIDFAMLVGSDYTADVRGIGLVTAVEVLVDFADADFEHALQRFRDWYRGALDVPHWSAAKRRKWDRLKPK